MEIEELDFNNPITIPRFYCFYRDVFRKCFNKDEIGSVEAYIKIKSDAQLYDNEYEYHLDFMKDDGKYVACFIYCWFPKIKMLAAEFACVEEHYRGKGLAKMLMKHVEQKYDFKWMFGEIEEYNQTNLSIWKKYGFKHVPIKYQQLSLGDGRDPVDNMKLCVYSKDNSNEISLEDVKQFVWHYYKYSQFCEDPDATKTVQYIKNMINSKKAINLLLRNIRNQNEHN